MNQEAVFALRFVVKDLAKMRKATEQMNENLKKLQKNAGGASKNLDKVNNSFGKVTRAALKFAAAYFTVSKIVGMVFSKANEALQLNEMAISAGIATEKIGKLGKALKLYGGDARSAGAAYASLTNIIGGAQHGMGISEDVARVNAMYGIGFNYGNISQEQLMTQIAKSMHRLKGQGDSFAIQQIASAYGLSNDVAAFLATHGANWRANVNAQQWEQMNMSEAQRLIKAEDDLGEKIKDLVMRLEPVLTTIANGLLEVAKYLETLVGWIVNKKKSLTPPAPKQEGYGIITDDAFVNYQKGLLDSGKITKEKFDEVVKDRMTMTAVPWATTALKNKSLAGYYADYIQSAESPLEEMAHLTRLGKAKFDFLPLASGAEIRSNINGQVTKIELINKSNTDLAVGNVKQTSGSGIPVSIRG